MKNILKKIRFVNLFLVSILTFFWSCGFMDANNDISTEIVIKDTVINDLSAEAEEYEKIENSHTLTAIFDEDGNVIAQEATTDENGEPIKSKPSAKSSINSKVDYLNNINDKNIEKNTLENKLGTISANEKNINDTYQNNPNDGKQNSKKSTLPSKVEIEEEQEPKSQKANNAIPNF